MNAAWKAKLPPAAKFVLMALCDWADDYGSSIYPRVSVISAKCGMSERAVQRALQELEDLGLIHRHYRPNRSTVYSIYVEKLTGFTKIAIPKDALNDEDGRGGGDKLAPLGCQAVTTGVSDSHPYTPQVSTTVSKKKSTSALGIEFLIEQGVPETVARDWLLVRKKRRAPLTETAWKALLREAKKAGYTPVQAVTKCAEKQWQGFEASYVAPRVNGSLFGQPQQSEPEPSGKTWTEADL